MAIGFGPVGMECVTGREDPQDISEQDDSLRINFGKSGYPSRVKALIMDIS